MKIIGLISWYEESPSWLAATVASMKGYIDHLVAVDGAYMLYPQGKPWSGSEQHAAILEVSRALNIGCTIHAPMHTWEGNEVEKRSHLFKLGEQAAEDGDWYFVMDADQIIRTEWATRLREELEATDLDVGETTFVEHIDTQATSAQAQAARSFEWDPDSRYKIRNLFRAIPGLRVKGNHYTYVTPDGRRLWSNENDPRLVECLDVSWLEIEHRTTHRDQARRNRQQRYYDLREKAEVERDKCFICLNAPAVRKTQTNLEQRQDGAWEGFEVEACGSCADKADAERAAVLKAAGLEDTLVPVGQAPQ